MNIPDLAIDQTEGDQLANFKLGEGDYGGIAGWSDDGADITIAKAYPPNDFGVYDMAETSQNGFLMFIDPLLMMKQMTLITIEVTFI